TLECVGIVWHSVDFLLVPGVLQKAWLLWLFKVYVMKHFGNTHLKLSSQSKLPH
ncbi:hypothetical protein KUCAC02_006035, partial [Chaenocephalus aceratus]